MYLRKLLIKDEIYNENYREYWHYGEDLEWCRLGGGLYSTVCSLVISSLRLVRVALVFRSPASMYAGAASVHIHSIH